MKNETQIKLDIEDLGILGELTKAYAQIASARMKKVREGVLKSRDFLEAINEIFRQVRLSYAREARQLIKRRRLTGGEKITFLAHNGKTVAVFLSSNTGLYGDIVQRTFEKFLRDVRETNYEVAIVGKLGLSLFLEAEPNRPYSYFELPDQGFDEEKFMELAKHVVQYEDIKVYYGKFQSVISQVATTYDISAEVSLTEKELEGEEKRLYLFEPSLEKILMFFEEEIFASVFQQALKESQLAKFASRVLAMDTASENIKKELSKIELERMRVIHQVSNRKQLNALTSIMAFQR